MKYKLIIVIFITISTSCIQEVDITDFQQTQSAPVIVCLAKADTFLSVYVGKTGVYPDTNAPVPDHAEVFLFDNNQNLLEKLVQIKPDSFQSFNAKIESNKVYNLKATIDKKWVEASLNIPDKPIITKIEFTENVVVNNEGQKQIEFILHIEDNPESNDFYELVSFIKYTDTSVDEFNEFYYTDFYQKTNNIAVTATDDIFLCEEYPIQNSKSHLFSDQCFNSPIQKISFFYAPEFSSFNKEFINHVLILQLKKINKQYYDYQISLKKHIDNQAGDFWYGTPNPIELYSNVENGYGVVIGYNQTIDSISYLNK